MRVLIGYDGSDGARDAVELARVFCSETGDDALLVRVIPNPDWPPYVLELLEETSESERFFEPALGALCDVRVRMLTYEWASPARALSKLAESENVDLIVIGSPHRGAIGRALIGSVAEDVLHGSRCPVLVAPRGYSEIRHDPFRRIAVAYDGTPESKAALKSAESLAIETNGTIELMTVLTSPVISAAPMSYAALPQIEAGETILAEAVRTMTPSLEVHDHLLSGPVPAAVAERCAEAGAELLVVGSRRYGPLARVVLGSVSGSLVHKAPCPVLVVPRDQIEPDTQSQGACVSVSGD